MFELPNAKRVRREELSDRSRTSSPDVEIENVLQQRLAQLYGEESETQSVLPLEPQSTTEPVPELDETAAADEEYEFRLFAPAPRTVARPEILNPENGNQIVDTEAPNLPASSKIRIASPDRRSISPGLITARPSSFYFSHPTDTERERFTQSALEGSSIIEESSRPWPGNHIPWRVIRVVVNSKAKPRSNDSKVEYIRPDMLNDEGRKRPGKKRRLKTRKLKDKASAAKEAAEEQERLFREKKTKKNRERKVKRKKKAAKDAAAAEAGDVEMADGSSA